MDDLSRLLLLLAAIVWAVAGAYARSEAQAHRGFAVLWLLALAGNVGLLVATDVVTFYAAFVVMTFAAYGLVVHTRTDAARRAGRVYVVLAVLGETALLGALMLAVAEASSTRLDLVAAAVAGSARRDLMIALLVVGFGIKAGVIGLHSWLPLAHPAAPFPASAVLSGSMIKAGLAGWGRLLPAGEVSLPGWADALILLGLATTVIGVVLGLTQRDPKVLLAYSSVSQMGFVTVLVGVALRAPEIAPVALAGAGVYAVHHGLAKAALFLGVGLVRRASSRAARRMILGGLVVAAASLTGLPATSGAIAKAWLKQGLDLAAVGRGTGLALSFAAAGTTVLMVRLLLVLRAPALPSAGPVQLGPWSVLVAAVVVTTPLVPHLVLDSLDVAVGAVLWDSTWPVLLGAILAVAMVVLARRRPLTVREVPPGDMVVIGERAAAAGARALARAATLVGDAHAATAGAVTTGRRALGSAAALDRLEAWTTTRRAGAVATASVALLLLIVLVPSR